MLGFGRSKGDRMAKELLVLWAGRHRRDRWEDLVSTYRERIGRTVKIRDRPLKASLGGSDQERRRRDGSRLLEALPKDSWTISLDASGEMLDSLEFADRLASLTDEWPHTVVFVLGSDVGLSKDVLDASRQVLSLGRMTLPHELARLVLYEQIYRGLAIRAGINYHR